ncbi:MAG: ABC transporter ATP-binding protein [Armatimonadota bacterium]|nr:ABC transporter ATP-binding protein [Armatimonadota bacterium]MDR7440369.1 ABC transporter ATP-binding protein [Armatimonadota bacterium]MDR7443575.1 ABC transporter ATP-binding protein [Armatimonadota bacterium]MDR7571255.1 ABC transporter ATP-binding protein [Armatimonadota bacterium]MDR7615073.1 ABC transporter ATP-binding protein [Armatimonadota bacterium]
MLRVAGLTVFYRKHRALQDVHLELHPRETVAVIGANGAGKSTLLQAIAGLVRPQPGARIEYEGKSVLGWSPERLARAGVVLVPEGRELFTGMTVYENLLLGAHGVRDRSTVHRRLEWVWTLFPRLRERHGQLAGTLSGGEQQMLAIARGLMAGPRLLLLDEPSLGLAPLIVREVFQVLQRIQAEGCAILLAEQNVRMSLRVAQRGYVLETGRVVRHGTAAELARDELVQRAYLGG